MTNSMLLALLPNTALLVAFSRLAAVNPALAKIAALATTAAPGTNTVCAFTVTVLLGDAPRTTLSPAVSNPAMVAAPLAVTGPFRTTWPVLVRAMSPAVPAVLVPMTWMEDCWLPVEAVPAVRMMLPPVVPADLSLLPAVSCRLPASQQG